MLSQLDYSTAKNIGFHFSTPYGWVTVTGDGKWHGHKLAIEWVKKEIKKVPSCRDTKPAHYKNNHLIMGPETFGFSKALELLNQGKRVARQGWNGEGMFVFLVQGSTFEVNRAPLNEFYAEGTEVTYRPHLDMKAADGTIGVWLASQTDILADDWVEVT